MVATNNLLNLAILKSLDVFDGVSYIAIGTGTTNPNKNDTTLSNEVDRVAIDSANQSSSTYTFSARIPLNAVTGEILAEVGGLDASSNGNLYFKELFPSTFEVTADEEIIFDNLEVEVTAENS